MKPIKFIIAIGATLSVLNAELIISEIDILNDKIEIINIGPGNENLTGYRLCNRLNGSPFYPTVAVDLIDAANSDNETLSLDPGEILTLQMGPGFIPDGSGEVGLYLDGSFGSASSQIDYVSWGADGVRDSVAGTKGIWESGTFVDVTGMVAGQTLQLGQGLPGNSKDEYSLAASTIGIDQVSLPTPLLIRSVSRTGALLTVEFSAAAGIDDGTWQVEGSSDLLSFPDDKSADSTITEIPGNGGLYQAEIDVTGEPDTYFIRIVLP